MSESGGGSSSNEFSNSESTAHPITSLTSAINTTTTTTVIIKGRKQALREAYNRSLNVRHSYYCITGDELVKSYKPFLPLLENQVQERGGSSFIITNIEKMTISAIKDLIKAGAQIRHMDFSGLRRLVIYDDNAAYFSIVEEPVITHNAIENVNQTEGEDLWISTTESSVVQSAKKHFLLDWKNAIPAEQRIREIEEGIEPEFLKVIIDTKEAGNILFNLAKSVKNEALSIMPNAHAMIRMEKLGVVKLLIEASQKGAVVKIICPIREANSRIAKWIFEQAPDIRIMEGCNDAQSGILIVDSKKFLQAEVKNPTADQFSDAIGFAIYSNSKRNVNSFKSFFELLWNEGVLNKELKIADKMQKDFINIAAHELRTPIQPILSLTELLHSKIKDNAEECQLLDVVIRNAKRLQRLTEDILDVSRIESNSLVLKKEQFNLDDMISTAAQDYNVGIEKTNGSKLKLIYEPNANRDIIVEADRDRLAQVFANLLDNAVKFTKEGTICLSMEKKDGHAIISLKDTGIGIDPQILPRLFTKFTTKSYEGTGLGLYISKSIVEAHGGRIWAENNKDGKGATFTFTLPIIKSINLT